MVRQTSSSVRFILLGLVVAFLYSALILPLAESALNDKQDSKLTLNQSGESHSSHQEPISLPGEEKEEENRGEKDSKFTLAILAPAIEYSFSLQLETTSFCFKHTHSTVAADIPLFLLKNSFLI